MVEEPSGTGLDSSDIPLPGGAMNLRKDENMWETGYPQLHR